MSKPNKVAENTQGQEKQTEKPGTFLEWKLIAAWEEAGIEEATHRWPKLTKKVRNRYLDLLTQLRTGYPLDYLLPYTEICGYRLEIREGVLIPRPETEELIEIVRRTPEKPLLLVDLGCGSGLIGICLSQEFARVICTDVSSRALAITSRNLGRNNVTNVTLHRSDLLTALPQIASEWWLVANLPYVPLADKTQAKTFKTTYEPDLAIYSGTDGLELFRRLVTQLKRLPHPPQRLFFELDPRNIRLAQDELNNSGLFGIEVIRDLENRERFLVAST